MNNQKEKLIIENLISSKDVFSRCVSIIKSSYFSPEFRHGIKFISEYYSKYRAVPTLETIKAESDIDLKIREITKDVFAYTCDTIEEFCRESAMKEAIMASAAELNKSDGNMGLIYEKVKEALAVSLPRNMGLSLYHDPEATLTAMLDTQLYIPTHIKVLDDNLDGGLARTQLTLFSANSGVGKSVMMANLGANYSKAGYRVLYISMELQEPMVYLRLASIATGVNIKKWKEHISETSYNLKNLGENGAGDYLIKRMPQGTTANDIRSFLKLYELENGEPPDVLILDYLDLMDPNQGIKNLDISAQDKQKSEQVTNLLLEFNCVGISASQQNRDGIDNNDPSQKVLAGGMGKVNTSDNYITIIMTDAMRLQGQMIIKFLKTRSADGVGKHVPLKFNSTNLIICDAANDFTEVKVSAENIGKKYKTGKSKSKADQILSSMKKPEKQSKQLEQISISSYNENENNINVLFEMTNNL